MTNDAMAKMIACQDELLAALDVLDVARIEAATVALAAATRSITLASAQANRPSIDHALKQADAARIRINCLSAWNRQKIDQLAELRGAPPAGPYHINGR